jgi:IS4 transposase
MQSRSRLNARIRVDMRLGLVYRLWVNVRSRLECRRGAQLTRNACARSGRLCRLDIRGADRTAQQLDHFQVHRGDN